MRNSLDAMNGIDCGFDGKIVWIRFCSNSKFGEIFCQFITNRFKWNFTCKMEKVIRLFHNFVESCFFVYFSCSRSIIQSSRSFSHFFRSFRSFRSLSDVHCHWHSNIHRLNRKRPKRIFTLAFLSHSLARSTSGMQISVCGGTLKAGLKLLKRSELRNSTRKKMLLKMYGERKEEKE